MRLLKAKTLITGIAAAMLLAIGTFTSTAALADHSSRHHGQQHFIYKDYDKHHVDRHRQRHNRKHGYRSKKFDRRLSKKRSRNFRHNDRYRYKDRGRSDRRRGNSNKEIFGALIGGAVIYHFGQKLTK